MSRKNSTTRFVRRVFALFLLILTPFFNTIIAAETQADAPANSQERFEIGKTRKITGKLARNVRSQYKKQKYSTNKKVESDNGLLPFHHIILASAGLVATSIEYLGLAK